MRTVWWIFMRKLPLLILGVVLGASPLTASALEPVLVDENLTKMSLGLHLEYLEDPTGELTLEDVQSPEMADKWVKSEAEMPNFGFTDSAYWFQVSLESTELKLSERYFELSYPLLDVIDLYLEQQGQPLVQYQLGRSKDFVERPLVHRNFIVPIEFESQGVIKLTFRVATESSMRVQSALLDPHYFVKQDVTDSVLQGDLPFESWTPR